MQTPLSQFQRNQLEVVAGVTPHAMAGHIINTTVLAIAVLNSVPLGQLLAWCAYSYAIALLLLFRHWRSRGHVPHNFQRAATRATIYAVFLALPWSIFAILYLGSLPHDQELVLVALGVGMAASGTILLSAIPAAAFGYMSGILIPSSLKCLFLFDAKGYWLIGVLSFSYWWFLAALVSKIKREINERMLADVALKESEARLQEALAAGQVTAFTWDAATGRSQHSENAAQLLGYETAPAIHGREIEFLRHVHPADRDGLATQVARVTPENPSYFSFFRFIRDDGREMWLEETGKAEFDADGRYLRVRGLTRDITERKRAEERLRLLVRELDHRVKNTLASVATVAQRTSEGSASMGDFLQTFEGRIQSLANAHALLSRSQWQGVQLAELVHSELAPYVREGSACVEGPEILLTAEATQPVSIVLHELVTNASKYGALSTPDGRISVTWCRLNAGDTLALEWTEAGGPPVAAPTRSGYGTGAIRKIVPYELNGTVDLQFKADGLRCRIELPADCVYDKPRPENPLRRQPPDAMPAATLPAGP